MTAALVALNFGLLIFGSIQVAEKAEVHPGVVFAFMLGILALGQFMNRIDDFSGDAHMGENE